MLKGVYSIGREEIKSSLLGFMSEVESNENEVIEVGLKTYAEQNLDFVGFTI